jgi:hypothetical protein
MIHYCICPHDSHTMRRRVAVAYEVLTECRIDENTLRSEVLKIAKHIVRAIEEQEKETS